MTTKQTSLDFPQALAEKYRPKYIADFIGLEKPKKVLTSFLRRPFVSTWLFLGPSGTGKTSMALALATALPAELHHIPSREADLDRVRLLTQTCHYVPMNCHWHLALFDEAGWMTRDAQASLLSKTDAAAPLPNTILILTANDTRTLEPQFVSRCHVLEFSASSSKSALPKYLAQIARAEGYRHNDLAGIAEQSGSNVRDALTRLEVELLAGDKKGIPIAVETPATTQHTHWCISCDSTWAHAEGDCRLPYRSVCVRCGGKLKRTLHVLRAKKGA